MISTEKILKWLDYAVYINRVEFEVSQDNYYQGRMVSYRRVRDAIKDGDFDD